MEMERGSLFGCYWDRNPWLQEPVLNGWTAAEVQM